MPVKKGILKKPGQRTVRKVKASVKFNNDVGEKFTKEEINQIIAAHKDMVATFNKHLPADLQISVDPNLEKKLQDPKLAKMYHLGKEIKERNLKQREIYDGLRQKYGSPSVNFGIHGSLRLGGTEEDKQYNENLYKTFKQDPQKFIYKQYKNVLETSGKELYELGDDPIKQAEYYLKNSEKCHYASNMASVVNDEKNKDLFTDEFKANIKSVASLAYNINQTKYPIQEFDSIEKIAFPELSQDQIEKLDQTSFGYDNKDKQEIRSIISAKKYGFANPSPKQIFDKIKDVTGVDLSEKENFATSTVFLDRQGNPMNVEGIFGEKAGKDFGEAKIVSDPTKKRDFRCITKGVKEAYMSNWKSAFNEKMGIKGDKLDINAIEEKNNGSFLQRMFRRPSKEYTAMMNAFKDYNNPESKLYMNKDHLNSATQAYVDHKTATGKKLSSSDKVRMDFAKNILNTNKEADKIFKDTENKMADVEVVLPAKKRVTFLLPEDVDVEIVTKKKESVVVKVNDEPSKAKENETEIEL